MFGDYGGSFPIKDTGYLFNSPSLCVGASIPNMCSEALIAEACLK